MMNYNQKIFIHNLQKYILKVGGQFQFENEPQYRGAIWGTISREEPLTILRLSNESLFHMDKVVDVIKKSLKGMLVKLEIVCPDDKTKIIIDTQDKRIDDKLILLKNVLSVVFNIKFS